MPSVAQQHARLRRRVDAVMTTAMRSDPHAVDAFLVELGDRLLDDHSRSLVREARRLVLACGAGLNAVLIAHRPGTDPYGHEICLGCGTPDCRTLGRVSEALAAYAVRPLCVDRAEAWRRAEAHFDEHSGPLLIEEFEHGFIARPVPLTPAGAVLVVDRHTGALTRWPSLPSDELIEQYVQHTMRA
jgi:hypothetical protein